MYTELVRVRVTARNLSPTTIVVDELCENMNLVDITGLAYHNEPVFYFPENHMPYDNRKLGENPLTRASSKDWDLWSIGMISLEIIVGSDLVLLLTTQEAVESLMVDIRPFIPLSTHLLLTDMLFNVRDRHAL